MIRIAKLVSRRSHALARTDWTSQMIVRVASVMPFPGIGLLLGSAPIGLSADRVAMVFDRVLTDAEISGDVLAGVAREGARASMVKTGARMTCSTGRAASAAIVSVCG